MSTKHVSICRSENCRREIELNLAMHARIFISFYILIDRFVSILINLSKLIQILLLMPSIFFFELYSSFFSAHPHSSIN